MSNIIDRVAKIADRFDELTELMADPAVAADFSRLSEIDRERQEIEDLVSRNRGVRVGLIAFASIAQVITPVTEDGNAILAVLPSISTDLVRLQGSRLQDALQRAETLLAGQPEQSRRNILLVSDGDFVEPELQKQVAELSANGIRLHILGIGTVGGGPVPGHNGRFLIDARGQTIESRLEEQRLRQLAEAGDGLYQTADYRDEDSDRLLRAAVEGSQAETLPGQRIRVWNERFYWPLLLVMLLLLPLFRRYRRLDPAGEGK